MPNPPFPTSLLTRLAHASQVVALTGAGFSAESGVPTFREAQTGLWARFDPAELATPEAFQSNPKRVWDWYQWRREKALAAQPHPGHAALAQLQKEHGNWTLITQNVDGLHQRAGSSPVIELHGTLLTASCQQHRHPARDYPSPSGDSPPRCTHCGSWMRPDVVWFGEPLPSDALAAAAAATSEADMFLSIGTSSLVYPAAGLAEQALRKGIPVVEINPESTPLTPSADFVLSGTAAHVLPALLAAI